jgi:beta-phosphoglucomutase
MIKDKLAIFDLDGTLFDTKDINYLSYKQAINEEGYDLDYNYFCLECNGNHYKEFLPKVLDKVDESLLERIHKRKKTLYSCNLNVARMNKHLFKMIDLIMCEYNIALVTTASRKNCEEILHHFDKYDLFDLILAQEDVENAKPNPEGFLKAMKHFNVSEEMTIIYEDSKIGIEAARRSNANVFVVNSF